MISRKTSVRRASTRAALVLAALSAAAPLRAECPPEFKTATQVVLVTAPTMSSVAARLRRFERTSLEAGWSAHGAAVPAVVGATGLGWAWNAATAPGGTARKAEGDKRTPAGIFPIGRPFGFGPASLPNYLQLQPGKDICVDELDSPHYGEIVPRATAGRAHGEDMGTVSLYRRGLVVDAPVSAARRSGSCIFIHVWRGPASGTVGCVALPEAAVADLQRWVRPGALVAILPKEQAEGVAACLRKDTGT